MKRLFLVSLVLTACGKPPLVVLVGDSLSFKTLQECKCPPGQFIQSITPREMMNGDIVAYDVQCVRVAQQ